MNNSPNILSPHDRRPNAFLSTRSCFALRPACGTLIRRFHVGPGVAKTLRGICWHVKRRILHIFHRKGVAVTGDVYSGTCALPGVAKVPKNIKQSNALGGLALMGVHVEALLRTCQAVWLNLWANCTVGQPKQRHMIRHKPTR